MIEWLSTMVREDQFARMFRMRRYNLFDFCRFRYEVVGPQGKRANSVLGLIANGQHQTARTNFADILDQIERVAVSKVENPESSRRASTREAGGGRP